MTLRGALLGAGNVALNAHVPGWLARPEVELVAAADVRAEFERLTAALNTLTSRDFEEPAALPADPTALSFRVAGALELEPEAKRALQAGRSTTARLRQLAALLKPLAEDATRRAVVRERAKRNGRGGAHSEIERAS